MRRCRMEIWADIIAEAAKRGGATKTQIVYGTNSNFKAVRGYLNDLVNRGLLKPAENRWRVTPEGAAYLDLVKGITVLEEL